MRTRYAAQAVTGLTEAEAEQIADYLGTIRPREGGRRLLRVAGVAVVPEPAPGGASRSGGPVEPRAESSGRDAPPAEDALADRLPAGPDPVLADGRPRKPLDGLEPRVRAAVERGAERWSAEGCAGCHASEVEVRAWAGAFPQVPLFRPQQGVVTLSQAVAHWRRRPAAEPDDGVSGTQADTDLVTYLAWRADGAPMAPGRAYPLAPAADLAVLEAAVSEGRVVALGAPGRLEPGACGGCHGGPPAARGPEAPVVPEITGSAATFPRFSPELGRVGTLEDYLTAHLAVASVTEPWRPGALGRPGSRELTALLAYLGWLARDRLVDVGRPVGARPRGSAELGREIYQLRCGICHAPNGRGRGLLGPGLAGLFSRERLASGRPVDAEAVTRLLRDGTRGMPAFFDLTAAQIEDLLAYLRTL